MSEIIIGIDLGTTNSAVGVVDSGFPILLANENGKRITPSAVAYVEGKTIVGDAALAYENCITSIKRKISSDEKIHGKSPIEISADILREMKRIAEFRLEKPIAKAVITVPAYFHESQRAATKKAGELAGLEVIRIINEPTAAALAYGLDQLPDSAKVAVYDLGGGTFDISILQMNEGVYQVLATHGDTQLGGDDIDQAIASHFSLTKNDARKVKIALSENQSIEISNKTITRAAIDDLMRPLILRSMNCCKKALHDAQLSPQDITTIVLVGGSTRIPLVRTMVAELFGKEPNLSQHPDEAIALGATIQAGMLSGALRKTTLLDVTPLSLGIETLGGLMNVIIPRNSSIPCKAGEMFTNAVANQSSMKIKVLQGEREMAKDNWTLGEIIVPFTPAEKGRARVGVQFHIDENGLLEILTRDTLTNHDTILTIQNSAVNVSDEAVEKMITESVDHAFTDMHERIFTEAKLKAEELIPAVEAIMESAPELILPEEKPLILESLTEIKSLLSNKNANALKAAVQKLDKATEALAARYVESLM